MTMSDDRDDCVDLSRVTEMEMDFTRRLRNCCESGYLRSSITRNGDWPFRIALGTANSETSVAWTDHNRIDHRDSATFKAIRAMINKVWTATDILEQHPYEECDITAREGLSLRDPFRAVMDIVDKGPESLAAAVQIRPEAHYWEGNTLARDTAPKDQLVKHDASKAQTHPEAESSQSRSHGEKHRRHKSSRQGHHRHRSGTEIPLPTEVPGPSISADTRRDSYEYKSGLGGSAQRYETPLPSIPPFPSFSAGERHRSHEYKSHLRSDAGRKHHHEIPLPSETPIDVSHAANERRAPFECCPHRQGSGANRGPSYSAVDAEYARTSGHQRSASLNSPATHHGGAVTDIYLDLDHILPTTQSRPGNIVTEIDVTYSSDGTYVRPSGPLATSTSVPASSGYRPPSRSAGAGYDRHRVSSTDGLGWGRGGRSQYPSDLPPPSLPLYNDGTSALDDGSFSDLRPRMASRFDHISNTAAQQSAAGHSAARASHSQRNRQPLYQSEARMPSASYPSHGEYRGPSQASAPPPRERYFGHFYDKEAYEREKERSGYGQRQPTAPAQRDKYVYDCTEEPSEYADREATAPPSQRLLPYYGSSNNRG